MFMASFVMGALNWMMADSDSTEARHSIVSFYKHEYIGMPATSPLLLVNQDQQSNFERKHVGLRC